MSVPTDIHAAVVALIEQDADPVLLDQEIDDAIERVAWYRPWAASTAYAFGTVIGPTVANGWTYRCVVPGSAGSTEPVWYVPRAYRNATSSAQVTDGTVTWEVSAPAPAQYDVMSGAAECWRIKGRKAANRVDVAVQGAGSARESVTYDRCVAMANMLQPMRFA